MDDSPHNGDPDAELEHRLGIRHALYTLWAPGGQAVTVSWQDSSIITATPHTRTRLVQVHSVIHAMLRDDHATAIQHLTDMTSLMAAFTALRSLTLTSEQLWTAETSAWTRTLAQARNQVATLASTIHDRNSADELLAGATSMDDTIRHNLTNAARQTIVECVADTAAALSQPARIGMGSLGAAAYSVCVQETSGYHRNQLVEEHAALLAALTQSQAITHRDGHLHVEP